MKPEPPIPTREQLHEAKFLEDQLQNLINLAATQENQSPADRQKMEQLFRNYRRLHSKLMEAARRIEDPDPLLENLDLRRQPILAQMQKRAASASVPASAPTSEKEEQPAPEINAETGPSEELGPPTALSHNLGPIGRPGVVSQGPEIDLLQQVLAGLGFQVPRTGEYDAPTLKAVRNFQLKAKLTITGVVEVRTRELLNRRLQAAPTIAPSSAPGSTPENTAESPRQSEAEGDTPQTIAAPVEQLSHDLGQQSSGKLSQGSEVLLLQKALQRAGFEPELSGQFELRTFSAVRKFQARQKLPVNGLVGNSERNLLNPLIQELLIEEKLLQSQASLLLAAAENVGFNLDSARQKLSQRWSTLLLKKILATPSQADPSSPPPLPPLQMPSLEQELGTPGQQGIVSQGPEVLLLQELLLTQGADIKLTEHFDLQTFTALRQYQEKQGLGPTGIVNSETRSHLKPLVEERQAQAQLKYRLCQLWREACEGLQRECSATLDQEITETASKIASLLHLNPEKLQALQRASLPEALVSDLAPPGRPGKVSGGDEVLLLQYLLRQQGVDLEESGAYDSATAAAVRAFQRGQKLPLTGEVDARVRALLNQSDPSSSPV